MSEVAFLRKGRKTKKKEKPKTISKKEFIPFDRRAKRNEKPQEENPTFAKVSYTNSPIISTRIKIKFFLCIFSLLHTVQSQFRKCKKYLVTLNDCLDT